MGWALSAEWTTAGKIRTCVETKLFFSRCCTWGICRQLPATRIGATPALAIQLTANSLLGAARRGQKRTLAVDTTAGLAHRDSSGFEMKSLQENRNPGT